MSSKKKPMEPPLRVPGVPMHPGLSGPLSPLINKVKRKHVFKTSGNK